MEVRAWRDGRRICDNIRSFIRYILTGTSAELWLLLQAPLATLPLPLLPIHIPWINLVTDGLPGVALAPERASFFSMGLASNPLLAVAVLGMTALQLAILHVPSLARIFRAAPLTTAELAPCLVLSAFVFVAVEIEKALMRRGFRYGARGA